MNESVYLGISLKPFIYIPFLLTVYLLCPLFNWVAFSTVLKKLLFIKTISTLFIAWVENFSPGFSFVFNFAYVFLHIQNIFQCYQICTSFPLWFLGLGSYLERLSDSRIKQVYINKYISLSHFIMAIFFFFLMLRSLISVELILVLGMRLGCNFIFWGDYPWVIHFHWLKCYLYQILNFPVPLYLFLDFLVNFNTDF